MYNIQIDSKCELELTKYIWLSNCVQYVYGSNYSQLIKSKSQATDISKYFSRPR